MADIEDLRATLTSSLDKFEKQVDNLDSKDPVSRNKAIKKLTEYIREIEDDLSSYEAEVLAVSVKQANKYQENLKQMNARFANLKKAFEQKKLAGTDRERLFKGIKKKDNKDGASMQTEEVIQRLKEVQEDDIDVLLGIQGNVEKFNDMADTINAQLDEQIKKLDNVNNIAKDTETELKRTGRYIRQFLRTVYTDKILMCLIFLIFCAIVTLIILNVTGISSKLAKKVDVVKKSASTTSSTTATRFLNTNIYTPNDEIVQITEYIGQFILSIFY